MDSWTKNDNRFEKDEGMANLNELDEIDTDYQGRYKDTMQFGGKKTGKKLVLKGPEVTFQEAIHWFFQLKHDYENKIKTQKKKIVKKAGIDNDSLSKRASIAKRALLQFTPSCVKCARPVGSIFEKKNDRFTAKCGDRANPCELNIELYTGGYSPVPFYLQGLRDDLEKLKETIIRQKLDTLFGYIHERESVALFKEELEGFSTYNEMLQDLTNKYEELYHNAEKLLQRRNTESDIFIMVERMRELLQQHKKDDGAKTMNTIVKKQIDELMPQINKLRLLKHEIMEMENGKLIKIPVSLAKTEYTFGEKSRVIHFVK